MQARNAMLLKAPTQRRQCQLRDRRLQDAETITQMQQRMAPEYNDRSFFGLGQDGRSRFFRSSLEILDSGPLSPFGHRLRGAALCHAPNCASEACDHCRAALTANVVVALPRRTRPIVRSSSPETGEHHHTVGSNT
jgi:hypothetical protein